MGFGGSHSGSFAFDGVMHSVDDDLMQRVWWSSGIVRFLDLRM